MLRINLPPTGTTPLTSADFENYHLPIPSQGIESQGNEDTFLQFDNEFEAVVYADQLEEIVVNVSKSSPARSMLRDMITTIRNDDTVRNYLENSTIYTWLKNCLSNIRTVIKPASYLAKN
jgi:hypothetical protein